MLRWPITLILVVLFGTACQSMPWKRDAGADATLSASDSGGDIGYEAPILPEPGLQLSTESRFADIPLPSGVKEDLDRTYVFESASLQIGRMVYSVRASVIDIAQFYIRECPISDWNLVSSLQAEGAVLVFEKPGKRLEVTVRDVGIHRGGASLVLNLTPQPQNSG